MSNLTFSFENYRLRKLDFIHQDVNDVKKTIEINQSIQCRHKIEKNRVGVLLTVRVEGELSPFVIEVTYEGFFKFNKDIEKEDKEKTSKIIRINCAGHLYPFLRETIAETTRKAGLQPLLLAPVNFAEVFKNQTEKHKIESS
jgi:protein-export chaperone SecB